MRSRRPGSPCRARSRFSPPFRSSARLWSSTARGANSVSAELTVTPAVRFFLSRVLSPHVQGGSRWLAVNAVKRQAFMVAGKDSGSPFLGWLAEGRQGTTPEFEGAAEHLGIDQTIDAKSFLGWYRQLNFGYPFLDYSVDDGRHADARLMEAYSTGPGVPESEPHPDARPLTTEGVDVGGG